MSDDVRNRPMLSVVLPAYNESHRLPLTLSELRPYLDERFPKHEVVVVDDGSTDATADIVRDAALAWPQLKLVQQPKNMGKGAAVKRGVLESTGDLVLFMDADHATPIAEMELVLPHLERGLYRAVVGVRTYQHDDSKWRRILGLSLQILTHVIVFDRAVVDSQCGFKCFGSDVAKRIFGLSRIKGGMFDVEIFVIMHRLGVNVLYQPVHWTNKAGSRINFIRCMLLDPVDMVIIRMNAMLGRYSERRPSAGAERTEP
ncbi:MAG TPA: glycosyltransferase [Dongiaceae bacterium]|nr:glycosyltransferase [Dongiaceae bacterium]